MDRSVVRKPRSRTVPRTGRTARTRTSQGNIVPGSEYLTGGTTARATRNDTNTDHRGSTGSDETAIRARNRTSIQETKALVLLSRITDSRA
ncbi:MAG: hypothetical protein SV760_04240 [Halobacteria archaeon]|nr:hypothetical protein [Halobacteria archaeon]